MSNNKTLPYESFRKQVLSMFKVIENINNKENEKAFNNNALDYIDKQIKQD